MALKSSLRSLIYETEKLAHRARFASQPAPPEGGWPILLSISFPKSGTHLLDQILLGFSKVAPFSKRIHSFYAEYEGESGIKRAPERALAWDFNYRGDLRFLAQARAQQQARRLTVEDGWIYFVHGWSQVVAEVFHLEIGPEQIKELSRIASDVR